MIANIHHIQTQMQTSHNFQLPFKFIPDRIEQKLSFVDNLKIDSGFNNIAR